MINLSIKVSPITGLYVLFLTLAILSPSAWIHAAPATQNISSGNFERDLNQSLRISDQNQNGLDLNSNFTLEAWVKLESEIPAGAWAAIIGKTKGGSSPDRAYGWYLEEKFGTKRITLEVHNNSFVLGGPQSSVDWNWDIGVWHYLAVTYNLSDGTAVFYVDGEKIGTTHTGDVGYIHNGSQDFQIGRLYNEDPYGFDGLIDEVRVWNTIRTDTEIASNYNVHLNDPTTINNLLGYWRLNESTDDETGHGNLLENNNGVTYSSDVPFNIAQEKSVSEMIQDLIGAVKGEAFPKQIEQSYLAHLEKLLGMLDSADTNAVVNQLEAFIKKLEDDVKKGVVTQGIADVLKVQAESIIAKLSEFELNAPLITQVASPYPSAVETESWASSTYAGGRASTTGDCGLTIKQCGCALSSLSMLGKYRGIATGVDGTDVNPKTMNNWLVQNNGYTNDGSILWNFALAYMGEKKNGKYTTHLALNPNNQNVTDQSIVKDFIREKNPVLGFNVTKGHWMLLRGTTKDGYYVNDPFWYNTKTTNDTLDVAGKVQDYNDVISKANLFSYSDALKPIAESVELVLESPAELLVTDSKGRRLGYDPVTQTVVKEIPGGSYDQEDFILNPLNPAVTPHKAKRLMLLEPEGNSFSLSVIGTGVGTYSLTSAVSDGKGTLESASVEASTSVGDIDSYTIITDTDEESLPSYLKDILNLVPASEQKKFTQAFKVIFSQTEKGHVVATYALIENLIRYTEKTYKGKAWAQSVVSALQNLL